MSIDMKPCPWCSRVPAVADISGGGPAYWVECDRCEATGPVDTSSSLHRAADAWNRRQVEDATARAEQRAEAAEAEVARWRTPHGEIDMLLPDVERVLLVAELGARLAPDIAADWMPRARSALAALRARDIGASAALEGAQRRYLEAEAEVARLWAAWAEVVAEVAAMGAEPDGTGQVLTERRSPATRAALREVVGMLADARPSGEVADV